MSLLNGGSKQGKIAGKAFNNHLRQRGYPYEDNFVESLSTRLSITISFLHKIQTT